MSERFISPHPRPQPWEAELLECLAEECAEVIQRATKALRFGLEEVQPGQPLTNSERISQEVGDLLAVLERLQRHGILSVADVQMAKLHKQPKLDRYLQHRPPVDRT